MSIHDAAVRYQAEGVPLLIFAGKDYGSGSSRDWAAKGPKLLGVRAVIAESFERIHRSNLVGMGILPLTFQGGQNVDSLSLTGFEEYTLSGLDQLSPEQTIQVTAYSEGKVLTFHLTIQVQSEYECECLRQGGLFQIFGGNW